MLTLFKLHFTWTSSLGLIACLGLGIACAWIVYHKPSDLSAGLKKTLFVFRALAVSLMAFLLFAPLVQLIEKSLEKPLVILAQDRSASIGLVRPPGFDSAAWRIDSRGCGVESKFSGLSPSCR